MYLRSAATTTSDTVRRSDQNRHHPLGKTCHHYAYHGLTCDEFDALHARAGGRCEICATPEAETRRGKLIIDELHGHARAIRGLLCDRCNAAMSCFDGQRPWGANHSLLPQILIYVANPWEKPPSDLTQDGRV